MGPRKIYLGTNTKMYKTIADTTAFLTQLEQLTQDIPEEQMELFVIPSFTTIEKASQCVKRIRLGGQNMGWEDEGQFTGEISPLMLLEAGATIAEIGHSERRHVLHETDEEENRKVLCALRHQMTALLCIGETAQQKEYGIADEVLRMQLKIGLHGVKPEQAKQVWVAYEPVWAIGVNGTPASADYAQARHATIRATLKELFGEAAAQIPALYGGSVNPQNAEELIVCPDIDGLFIGRSAWQAQSFNGIIRKVLPLFAKKNG